MIEKAVIDRFEEDLAVILLGDQQTQLVLPRQALPEGARDGDWLQVEVVDETIRVLAIDEDETARARRRISEKLARLRRGKQHK